MIPSPLGVHLSIEAQTAPAPRAHVVQFYADDEELVRTVCAYIDDALSDEAVAIVVATDEHVQAFEAALVARGIDVVQARARDRLVVLDAHDTLAKLVAREGLRSDAFDLAVGDVVREASKSGRGVRAYGEMVALLWDRGDVTGALELEMLWNALGIEVAFSLLCAYPASSMLDAQHVDACHRVCELHSGIVDRHADIGERATGRGRNEESRAFKCGPDAPYAARRFVIAALEEWGIPDLIDDAACVVSELATNAVVHAASDFVVGVSVCDATVRISVRDSSVMAPAERVSSSTATRGRGIAMIAALSTDWGVERAGAGKEVWAELRCSSATLHP
jgi:hypothetical protein